MPGSPVSPSARLIELAELEAKRIADYKRDRSHPCARFVFNVLAAWDPGRYAAIASQLTAMQTKALIRMPEQERRDKSLRRYVRLFQLIEIEASERLPGDIVLMALADARYMSHCGLWTDMGIIHLHPKRRTLAVELAESLTLIMTVRK